MQTHNKQLIGFDFDGVITEGIIPKKGDFVITGNTIAHEKEVRSKIPKEVEIHFYPSNELEALSMEEKDVKIGQFKAQKIKSLGITKFFEDSEVQAKIIKDMNPTINLMLIKSDMPGTMKFIIFTHCNTIMPVAWKLQKEGNKVFIAQIDDGRDVLTPEEMDGWKPEKDESKRDRMRVYDGILKKEKADNLKQAMGRIQNKDEYFFLSDSNNTFKYAEYALDKGYKNGIFPTLWDRKMEVDRNAAKDFVRMNYPDLKVAEVIEFKKVNDGVDFIQQSEKMWVLKSSGDQGDTVVPESNEPEIAKELLIGSLKKQTEEYETNGFLLEEKIIDPIELTPQVVFYNGEPIYYSLDIENKPFGAGNQGVQSGCATNLIIRTDAEDLINKIAFPPVVYEMAKKRKGLFIMDASILIDSNTGDKYFGEFCSQRFGWDSFPTELAMSGDEDGNVIATRYFERILRGENPLINKFGIGVRLFNIDTNCKILDDGDVTWTAEAEPDFYPYEIRQDEKGKYHSTASGWDFGVVTGVGDTIEAAIEKCFTYIDMVGFEAKYYRPKFDLVSQAYPTAIFNRLGYAVVNGLIDSIKNDIPEMVDLSIIKVNSILEKEISSIVNENE